MAEIETGGPAYPQLTSSPLPYGASRVEVAGGMTLRDYFAGQALIGAMNGATGLGDAPADQRATLFGMLAAVLYEIADAMLTERAKGGQ